MVREPTERGGGSGGGGGRYGPSTMPPPSSSSRRLGHSAEEPKPYLVLVSKRFIILSLLSSILLAFTIGRAARIILLEGPRRALLYEDSDDSSMYDRPDYHEAGYGGPAGDQRALPMSLSSSSSGADSRGGGEGGGSGSNNKRKGKQQRSRGLPEPVLMEGREVPHTVYSSRTYISPEIATSSSMHITAAKARKQKADAAAATAQGSGEGGWHVCRDGEGGQERKDCRSSGASTVGHSSSGGGGGGDDNDDEDNDEEQHLPSGQHLLVDIKNVDGTFLNSEERLARAMIDVVDQAKLTLLSYHCHSLIPMGVSCVGVLLESHISFHTWPNEGVITLDLFTCGSNPLVPVLPIIESLFGVPRRGSGAEDEDVDPPGVVWAHKLRGFRGASADDRNPLALDLGMFMLEIMDFDMKREVVSVQSDFQRIDVYEVIRPRFRDLLSYQRSLTSDGSYESLHPELYRPDRVLFLDGVMQSTLYGDEAYHEALVHPGMFAHPNPRRVAIIGGGEGATLREVLKHRTVEKAIMIEIDEIIVKVAREHLPSWPYCGDMVGSTDWCGDDARAEIYYEDALAWFIDRYSATGTKRNDGHEPFDVIIMDALDPQDDIPFARALYDNDNFLRSLKNALSDDGVIIMQQGEASGSSYPAEHLSKDRNRAKMNGLLVSSGFESIHVYEEGHSGFLWPWSYLVALKNRDSRALWYSSPAEVDLAIRKRILKTKSGAPPLRYFDGATMKSYQLPHKVVETVFCRIDPTPAECIENRGHQLGKANVPVSALEVRNAAAGGGVFAKDGIAEGSMIAADESPRKIKFPSRTIRVLNGYDRQGVGKKFNELHEYVDKFGSPSTFLGQTEYVADSSIKALINHGCDGTYNIGSGKLNETELTVDPSTFAANLDTSLKNPYHPVIDRHMDQHLSSNDYALRDIVAGEEILSNRLDSVRHAASWLDSVNDLRALCKKES